MVVVAGDGFEVNSVFPLNSAKRKLRSIFGFGALVIVTVGSKNRSHRVRADGEIKANLTGWWNDLGVQSDIVIRTVRW